MLIVIAVMMPFMQTDHAAEGYMTFRSVHVMQSCAGSPGSSQACMPYQQLHNAYSANARCSLCGQAPILSEGNPCYVNCSREVGCADKMCRAHGEHTAEADALVLWGWRQAS